MTSHGTSPDHSTHPGHATIDQPIELKGRRGRYTTSSHVMLTVTSVVLVLGLIGIGPHLLWIGVILVMGIGLGYVSARSGLDGSDSVPPRRAEHG